MAILEKPKQGFGGNELYPGIFTKAAVYLDGFTNRHVFVDGNKRTAFATAIRFLETNGYAFRASNPEVIRFVLSVATTKPNLTHIATWLKRHARKTAPGR